MNRYGEETLKQRIDWWDKEKKNTTMCKTSSNY